MIAGHCEFRHLERDVATKPNDFSPILTSFARSAATNQCSTSFGNAKVRLWLIALVWAFVLRDRSAPDSGHMSGYVGFRPLRFRTAPNFGRGLGRCDMTQLILNGLLKTDKVPA